MNIIPSHLELYSKIPAYCSQIQQAKWRRAFALLLVALAAGVGSHAPAKPRVHLASPPYRNDAAGDESAPFRCPSKCTCETSAPRRATLPDEGSYSVDGTDGEDSTGVWSVYCHRGGLNDSDFFHILQVISGAPAVAVLDVRAPPDRPNTFQWNDNLNRLTRLRQLALVNCAIPALSRSVRMPALRHLDLSQNRIGEIRLGTFIGLPLLESLDVSHNRITALPTGAFMYSPRLLRLSLSHNGMQDLSASMLRGPEGLLELELDGNGPNGRLTARQVNELFMDVGEALERLELNSCGLGNDEVDAIQFSRTPRLRRLGLANNSLNAVPSVAIRALARLQTLDLAHNQIRRLEPCSFCACNITRVLLAHNLLGLDVHAIDGRPPHAIASIHREAFADTRLVELDLSHNFFPIFDAEWLYDAQPTLRHLHLSGNRLELRDELLRGMPRLTHLHLAQAQLRDLPAALPRPFAQLRFLNLSSNGLHDLPTNVRYLLPQLHTLDLSHNQFSGVSPLLMSTFVERLDLLYLHHNPWDCACGVQALQQYMLQRLSYRRQLGYERTLCARPALLRGQPLHRVQKINDCAVLFGASYGLTQISELLLLLSGLLIAAFIVFVLVILTLHCGREHKRKAVYVTNEHSRIQLTRDGTAASNAGADDSESGCGSGATADELDAGGYGISAQLLGSGSEKPAGLRFALADGNNNKFNNNNGSAAKLLNNNNNSFNNKIVAATIRQKRNYRTPPPPPGSMFVTF